ncbi:carboxylic acid reductase [Streptomyces sp. NPDC005356]|uniref:carboxylic acid reductase n=1 Tax=Streptomyces sp. NPDC005356 TaxID=3157167 RepID=UPI0033A4F16A
MNNRQEYRSDTGRTASAPFGDLEPIEAVSASLRQPGKSLSAILETVMTAYADRPALAVRVPRAEPRFDTISYRTLWERAGAIAADWYHHSGSPVRPGDLVCTLGFTSAEYVTVDLACTRLGGVVVALQNGADVSQLTPVVAETGPRVLATSLEQLGTAVQCALDTTEIARLLVFDYDPSDADQREVFEAAASRLRESARTIELEPLAAVLERGATLPPIPALSDDPDRLCLLVYTSGSTGSPKGAMYTDFLVASLWRKAVPKPEAGPMVGVNFLPLSHLAGRTSLMSTLAAGGTSCFASRSDLSTLFDDFAEVRPTRLFLVPRVLDMLFQRYSAEVDRRAATESDRARVEEEVKTELREKVLGGRLRLAGIGSAPVSPEMAEFTESCLRVPLIHGYGMTEAGGGVLSNHRVLRPLVQDYRLVDVPELGYLTTDTPHPRGELLLKTQTIFAGYYKRPELTASVFDENGFYRTGDIMAQVGHDELVYIDRRSNVLKLSQGEFVTISNLESAYATSPLVRQIFIYGNSERAYPLAVVVPTDNALHKAAGDTARLRTALHESLRAVAREARLQPYEIPRDFLVETEPFSTANGLLSDIRKLLRPRVTERYRDRLEQLYAELAEQEKNELRALRRAGQDEPALDLVLRAARATLGSTDPVDPDARFIDLGGDSLSALSFARLLEEIFQIEVPVSTIISPANDLRKVTGAIERARGTEQAALGFADVHSPGARQVRAAELTLDAFLAPDVLAAAHELPGPSTDVRTVLVTGANGYLGRFLCLDWLERMAARGGTVVCLVRGADEDAARARLDAAFDSGDPVLSRRFRELAAQHLVVVPGDLGEPGLGLTEASWQRLASNVDLIVHPGALVNHVLPYEQLFGPNVVGTAELIRLALTTRKKRFIFLSTVAVVTDQAGTADEDSDIRETSPVRDLNDRYANGYGTSKWAGEILLREAHDKHGLPVAVFRSDMILAHSDYRGQLNAPDLFTRLLFSLVATGVAPRSFYRGDASRAHYDGLPVDFTATAVTELGERVTSGYRTFNVVNPHDDGISLDTFVDWLTEDGRPITRIDDYADWLERFRTALRALPEERRQHSVLPLLHAFERPSEATGGAVVPAERFRAAVRATGLGWNGEIPHLGQDLIKKYLADLETLGIQT